MQEKKRREEIKCGYEELRKALPSLKRSKARVSRQRILQSTLTFIQNFHSYDGVTYRDVSKLKRAIKELEGNDGTKKGVSKTKAGTQLDDLSYVGSSDSESIETSVADELVDRICDDDISSDEESEDTDEEESEDADEDKLSDDKIARTTKAGELSESEIIHSIEAAQSVFDENECFYGTSVSETVDFSDTELEELLKQPLDLENTEIDFETLEYANLMSPWNIPI